jgi:hypothetical protein
MDSSNAGFLTEIRYSMSTFTQSRHKQELFQWNVCVMNGD